METLPLRRLGRNILATYAVRILTLVCGVAANVILARVLGSQGMGVYQLTVLIPLTLTVLLGCGIPAANIFFIGRGSLSVSQAVRLTLALWAGMSAFGVLAAVAVLANWSDHLMPGVPRLYLLIGACLFPLLLMRPFLVSLLWAREDFFRVNSINTVVPVTSVLGAALFVWALDWELPGAIITFGLAELVALSVASAGVYAQTRQSPAADASAGLAVEFLRYGWRSHLCGLIHFLNMRADLFLVGFFLGPQSAGVYAIAIMMAEQSGALSEATGAVLFPRLAALHHDDRTRGQLTPLVTRWTFLSSLVIAAVIAAVGYLAIQLLFGGEFVRAFGPLLLLLPGIVLLAGTNVMGFDLGARGRPDLVSRAAALGLLANVVGNIALIPIWGICGAAISSTLSYALYMACITFFYVSLTGNSWWHSILVPREDLELLGQFVKSSVRAWRSSSKTLP